MGWGILADLPLVIDRILTQSLLDFRLLFFPIMRMVTAFFSRTNFLWLPATASNTLLHIWPSSQVTAWVISRSAGASVIQRSLLRFLASVRECGFHPFPNAYYFLLLPPNSRWYLPGPTFCAIWKCQSSKDRLFLSPLGPHSALRIS